jgi:hypothetical protein
MEENSGSTYLQKKAARTSTSTTTTGIKKIDEEDEEEEDEEILGMKKRNWRKINLSFTAVLDGQDREDIREPDHA